MDTTFLLTINIINYINNNNNNKNVIISLPTGYGNNINIIYRYNIL